MTSDEFSGVASELFGSGPRPKPLHLIKGVELAKAGLEVDQAAKAVGTSFRTLERLLAASDPVQQILGVDPTVAANEKHIGKIRLILGQLVLGRCAEYAFEDIYKSEMHTEELELRDLRENRSDTDYRLFNGHGRPVYRINIKFHGSRFRRAAELVHLEPNDCFALATYKIHSSLQKQEQEGLPYFFAIVGVSDLSGENVGSRVPARFVEAASLFHLSPKAQGKRDFEDAVVNHLTSTHHDAATSTLEKIKKADWYMMSARRADKLLRQFLFERVYALRIRGFAQQFRGAELDMHFSLSNDLIPLREFLRTLKEGGQTKITTLMERGDL